MYQQPLPVLLVARRRRDRCRSRAARTKMADDAGSPSHKTLRPLLVQHDTLTSAAAAEIPEYIRVFNYDRAAPAAVDDQTYTLRRVAHAQCDECHGGAYRSAEWDGARCGSLQRGPDVAACHDTPAYFELETSLRAARQN